MNPGDLISGKYRLQRLLGSGGMGSVWAARNQLTDRDFAIKFLLPSLSSSQEALQRFFHEARACGQIKHPAVVDVYDMGQAEDGSPYLVMELLEGEGLDRRLKHGALSPTEAAAWIAFIARGLEEAHVRGLVHRDLKPANVFLCNAPSGEMVPKILDFGISKPTGPRAADFVRTSAGVVLGSPAYMSPEQAKGEIEIDGRSDVWSLGVILYEALTGKLPFSGANYNALMVSIISNPHPPINAADRRVPRELSAVVDRALAKDRGRRIGTARELAERLEAVLATLPAPGAPSSRKALTLRPGPGVSTGRGTTTQQAWVGGRRMAPRSRAGVIGLGALISAVVLAGGTAAFLQLRPAPAPVAARSSMLVTASLARFAGEVAQMKAQIAAEQRAEAERKAQAAAEERAKAEQRAAEQANAPRAGSRTRNPQRDPHGGVDNPGF